MDVVRYSPYTPTERPSLASLPRLRTTQLSPVLQAQRRKSRLSNLFGGLQRSLSGLTSPASSVPSPISPAASRIPWPTHLSKHICPYLDLDTLLQVRLVDRAFNAGACNIIAERHSEAVLPKLMTQDVRLHAAALRRDPKVEWQSLLNTPLGTALLAQAERLALKHAEAEGWERPRWRSQMLLSVKLQDCPKLLKLHLSCHGPMPSRAMVSYLGDLTQLRYLSVTGGNFAGYDLAQAWRGLVNLNTLALSNVRYGAIVALLLEHPELEILRLAYTPGVAEDTVRHIATMPRLRTLELIGNDLDDASLAPLRSARALKHLDVSYNKWLTPGAIAQLAPKTRIEPLRLEQLIIAGVPIDETSASAVAAMGFLHRLWAPDSHMTPWGVRIVSHARQLQIAALRGQILFPHQSERTARRHSNTSSIASHVQNRPQSLMAKRREVLCDVFCDALDDAAFGASFFRVLTTGWTQVYTSPPTELACNP